MAKKWLYWLEELCARDLEVVGKKCANLGEMTRAGMRVPPGFAIAIEAYYRFMEETGVTEDIRRYLQKFGAEGPTTFSHFLEASKVIRDLVESREMPPAMRDEIVSYYEELCRRVGQENLAVAVRSSGPVSLPGQFETYLNVRGAAEVVRQVVRVWGSTFTTQAIAHRAKAGLPIESAGIGVAVIKMVHARTAGVAFTAHPTTGDQSKIVVEASWGLGESVVGSAVSPDRFIIDKHSRSVEKQINPKTKQVVYGENGTVVVDVPAELQAAPCLADNELVRLAELAEALERYYGVPQDIEWALDRDLPFPQNLFVLQTRPVKFAVQVKSSSEQILDLMVRTVFGR